jgi:hypothetical protein
MPRAPDPLIHRARVLRSSFLRQDGGDHLRISFARCFDTHLGLRLRAEEAHRCIRRVCAAGFCSWSSQLLELRCVPEAAADVIEGNLDDLAKALARIAWRPLTPRLVVMALGISGRERARWTKDGRLPPSGQVFAHRGHLLSVPTYSVRLVEDLAARPEISTAWREQDAAAQKRT